VIGPELSDSFIAVPWNPRLSLALFWVGRLVRLATGRARWTGYQVAWGKLLAARYDEMVSDAP
jgi:hypothetical protein